MIDVQALLTKSEKAVLVSVSLPGQKTEKVDEYLGELEFLTSTLGVDVLGKFTQNLQQPDKKTFVGKGKLEEINLFVKENEADLVIFDDDLSASQVRNLEKALECKIYDRSLLILDIFLFRAKTARAVTQVELARYEYMLPRLTRLWSHLERQRGGTSTRGGAGEKELETDKRIIRDKITRLKQKLEKIDKQGAQQRKGRQQIVRVSMVGYTNVGKSTLMNRVAKAEVFAENKLFATLDSTVRKVALDHIPFLLTDTVGFIRKLPTTLIECFKSTLDEIREADLLLHVVDISHPAFEDQIETVHKTLTEIGAVDKPVVMVFNKIDEYEKQMKEYEDEEISMVSPEDLKNAYFAKGYPSVFISAKNKTNLNEFRQLLKEQVAKIHYTIYPHFVDYTQNN